MRHTLTVYKDRIAGCWMIIDSNPRVLELFGTDTLPSAYTCDAEAKFVHDDLQRLNPDAEIIISI